MFSRNYVTRFIKRFKTDYVRIKRPKKVDVNIQDNGKITHQINTDFDKYSDKSDISKKINVPEILKQKIISTGPITIAQFMSEALANPICGYYMREDVIGKTGDFVTSPEICQLFGELIAVWLLYYHKLVGLPKPYNLIELGPGRGTMMRDILNTFRQLDRIGELTVHLIEISETLSNVQAEKLCESHIRNHDVNKSYYRSGKTKDGINIYWYKSIFDLKFTNFSLIVAHEFFDALPIHKFKKTDKGWCEVLIDIDGGCSDVEPKFRYVLSDGPTVLARTFISAEEKRDELELSIDGMYIMNYLSQRLWEFGGIALIIDYGHNGTKSDTFRAFKNHQQVDPLANAGTCDITADVDFSYLTQAAENRLVSFGPVTQRCFLQDMRIDTRREMLLKKYIHYTDKKKLVDACNVLIDKDKMGHAFQFVSYFPAVIKNFLRENAIIGFPNKEKEVSDA